MGMEKSPYFNVRKDFSFIGQIRKRLRIWSCAPVQVPELCQGIGPSGHPAEDLTGGGPGAAAVINAVAERGGQVCFGHGEDFFPKYFYAVTGSSSDKAS